jgi:hypothetical protein
VDGGLAGGVAQRDRRPLDGLVALVGRGGVDQHLDGQRVAFGERHVARLDNHVRQHRGERLHGHQQVVQRAHDPLGRQPRQDHPGQQHGEQDGGELDDDVRRHDAPGVHGGGVGLGLADQVVHQDRRAAELRVALRAQLDGAGDPLLGVALKGEPGLDVHGRADEASLAQGRPQEVDACHDHRPPHQHRQRHSHGRRDVPEEAHRQGDEQGEEGPVGFAGAGVLGVGEEGDLLGGGGLVVELGDEVGEDVGVSAVECDAAAGDGDRVQGVAVRVDVTLLEVQPRLHLDGEGLLEGLVVLGEQLLHLRPGERQLDLAVGKVAQAGAVLAGGVGDLDHVGFHAGGGLGGIGVGGGRVSRAGDGPRDYLEL